MDSEILALAAAASALDDQQAAQLGDLTVSDLRTAAGTLELPDHAEPSQPASQAPATDSSSAMSTRIRQAAGR